MFCVQIPTTARVVADYYVDNVKKVMFKNDMQESIIHKTKIIFIGKSTNEFLSISTLSIESSESSQLIIVRLGSSLNLQLRFKGHLLSHNR